MVDHSLMKPFCRMIELLLQRALVVREASATAAELHRAAYVVLAIKAVLAGLAWYACLQSHAIPDFEPVLACDIRTKLRDHACGLVALGQRLPDLDVAVTIMCEIVDV